MGLKENTWTIFANRQKFKTLLNQHRLNRFVERCCLYHTIESHVLVSLQLKCNRNGQRTIQLPELSPGPAGLETRSKFQIKDEVLEEHSTLVFYHLFTILLLSVSPWSSLVFFILSFSLSDIILEALGLFDWCLYDCVLHERTSRAIVTLQ